MSTPPAVTPSLTPGGAALRASFSQVGFASPLSVNGLNNARDLGISLTHGEIAELHEGFRMLAGNNVVQQIGLKELKEVLVSVGFPAGDDLNDDIFRVANQQCMADHLTFPEFVLLMSKTVDERMQEELKSAFRHYDKLGTGYVTAAQFCEMLATMGEKSSPEEVNELLMFADPEGTGRIEYGSMVAKLATKLR